MDVIGNNIANVNTAAYKTSRVIFQDIFSQTVKGGMANNEISGGTNPMQIGLGIKLSTIDIMHNPAPFGRTDNPYDMMISGDGFFVIKAPNGGYYYTRAGNFKLDNEGYLVTSDGYYVMGYTAELTYRPEVPAATDDDEPIPATVVLSGEIDIGPLQKIRLKVDGTGSADPIELTGFSIADDGSVEVLIDNEKVTIAQLAVALFSNYGGLEKAGNSMYRATSSSGSARVGRAQENGAGEIVGGGLEMSNVDLATEFTDMIVTQRGFQANSRIITVSDTLLEELVNLKR